MGHLAWLTKLFATRRGGRHHCNCTFSLRKKKCVWDTLLCYRGVAHSRVSRPRAGGGPTWPALWRLCFPDGRGHCLRRPLRDEPGPFARSLELVRLQDVKWHHHTLLGSQGTPARSAPDSGRTSVTRSASCAKEGWR
jgi:hypothetical protein